MNQLDNAFGDNNNNNGVPNPVVIMGQNPSVWLGPNYDEEAQKNGEQKANGNENNMNPQTWETINRQIQQNMIGNVSLYNVKTLLSLIMLYIKRYMIPLQF